MCERETELPGGRGEDAHRYCVPSCPARGPWAPTGGRGKGFCWPGRGPGHVAGPTRVPSLHRVCGPHGVPGLQQRLSGHARGRVSQELPHAGRGLCELAGRAQGRCCPEGVPAPPLATRWAVYPPWVFLGHSRGPAADCHLHVHSSALTACLAASAPGGSWRMEVGAAWLRRTVPACTTRPPTVPGRPSGSTVTPGRSRVPQRQSSAVGEGAWGGWWWQRVAAERPQGQWPKQTLARGQERRGCLALPPPLGRPRWVPFILWNVPQGRGQSKLTPGPQVPGLPELLHLTPGEHGWGRG